MRIVDLSLPIDEKAFEVHHVDIERVTHKAGVEKFNRVLMGKTLLGKIKYLLGKRIVKKEDFPDEEFLSLEIVHAPVHIGTHLDYSFHYGSKSENRPSKTASIISDFVIVSFGFLWVKSSFTPSAKHHSSGISSAVLDGRFSDFDP